jgi:hypothetical protein
MTLEPRIARRTRAGDPEPPHVPVPTPNPLPSPYPVPNPSPYPSPYPTPANSGGCWSRATFRAPLPQR